MVDSGSCCQVTLPCKSPIHQAQKHSQTTLSLWTVIVGYLKGVTSETGLQCNVSRVLSTECFFARERESILR